MNEAWINFAIVVFVQFVIFIVSALYLKKVSDVSRVLTRGVLMGIIVGIPFDLVAGNFFGVHSFALGFGALFLILNATFSYGLFAANTLLMQQVRLSEFLIWISFVVLTCELANHFFPVWIWGFTLPFLGFVIVLWAGYLIGAIVGVVIWHMLLGYRFAFIDRIFQK